MSTISFPTHYQVQYGDTIRSLLQQQGGKLAQYITVGSYKGESASPVDQVGRIASQRNLPRFSDTPLTDVPTARRWISPNTYDAGFLIDNVDKIRTMLDPQSQYTQNLLNTLRRDEDGEILIAAYDVAKTGKTGTTNEAWSSDWDIGVNVGGTASNLNVTKLRAVKSLFARAGVPPETPITAVITSRDHDGLLNEIQITSSDFNGDAAVLKEGRVTRFLGINFVQMEFNSATDYPTLASWNTDAAAPLYSSTIRYCPFFVADGLHLGRWDNLNVRMSEREDKRYCIQTYATQSLGATRLELGRVIRVACQGGN